MIEVVPAIIPETFEELKTALVAVHSIVPLVQIDIMDGSYAPGKTWPYIEKIDPDFKKILAEEEGFPFWEDVGFEADMMIDKPERVLNEWISAGAENLIIHIETTKNLADIIKRCHEADVKVGLALKPSTPSGLLDPFVSDIDFVQFMGSDNIGHHGEELDPAVLAKIRDFKKKYPNTVAGVDIGVNLDTAQEIIEAGATRLVAGSAIFDSGDVKEVISQLRNSTV